MNNWALIVLLVLGLAVIIGISMPLISGGTGTTDSEAQGAIDDFGSTLLDETDDVEIGSLI